MTALALVGHFHRPDEPPLPFPEFVGCSCEGEVVAIEVRPFELEPSDLCDLDPAPTLAQDS